MVEQGDFLKIHFRGTPLNVCKRYWDTFSQRTCLGNCPEKNVWTIGLKLQSVEHLIIS